MNSGMQTCLRITKYKPCRYLLLSPIKIFFRNSTISTRMVSKWSNPQELIIPMAHGHVAAKAWGKRGADPVLALHGWQDNAGTFDKLIPLLSSDLYIIAVDLPGHGLSSHKPLGSRYHFMESIIFIKEIVDYLKWKKFSLIGHSLGGTQALMFCSVFPECIKNIVLLDILKPASRERSKLPDSMREGVLSILNIESKVSNPTPVYSYEDARTRLIIGMYDEITPESAEILLKRGCQPSKCGKGVIFTRDIRVKMTEDISKMSHEDTKAYMSRIQCNMLIIRGKSSFIFRSRTPEVLDEFEKLYETNCKSFKVVALEGNHFVHLNNSDLVAPHVDLFFKAHSDELSKL